MEAYVDRYLGKQRICCSSDKILLYVKSNEESRFFRE